MTIEPPNIVKRVTPQILRRLGDELDAAERRVAEIMEADEGSYFFSPDSVPFEEYETCMHRRHEARTAYGLALTDRNNAAREKFRNRKTPIQSKDAFKFRDARLDAEIRFDELDELGPDFYTAREWLDANAAFTLADWTFDHAQEVYHSEVNTARRRDAADRASNIVRKTYRRKSYEVHL